MELLISNLDESPSLLLNRGKTGNWILLHLKGTRSNRSAIGARVSVKTNEMVQMQEVKSGGSYQSQNDLRLHFGLGNREVIQEIQIRWPTGDVQELNEVSSNQILTVVEAEPVQSARP